MFNNFLNRIIVNDHLPLRYQHEVQGTKEPNSIFLLIQKYRYVHFWDKDINYRIFRRISREFGTKF